LKVHLLFITSFILFSGFCFSQDAVTVEKYTVGDSVLTFHVTMYYPHSPSVSFINLHDDENTGVDAGLDFLSKYGGKLLQLQHSGKRHFTFTLTDQSFSFDPNRIFSEKGLRATLENQSMFREDAAIEVKRVADSLLINHVNDKKLVVALHNNSERGLSVISYLKGGPEAVNAARVYRNPAMNPHDFMLTTDKSLYHHLKHKKFNVVLQHHNPVDDGSLSVYAAKMKIPYINIEALQGHLEEQVKMLEAIKDIIYRY